MTAIHEPTRHDTSSGPFDGGLELLDERECMALLAARPMGRVGISVGALPAILPVNHKVIGDTIVFCTTPGTKLSAAVRGAVVAFEVDDFDPITRTGWSVLAVGEAREIHDPQLLESLLTCGATPWAPGVRSHLVRITPTFLSGRRIRLDRR